MKKYSLLGFLYYVYPPLFCFSDEINSADFKRALSQYKPDKKPLCLYLHFPFCKRKCHFCFAFSVTGKDESYVDNYITYLKKHIDLVIENSNVNKKMINAMLWGGGTPTYLTAKQLKDVYQHVTNNFEFMPDAEITVELESSVTDAEKIETLVSLGANRFSFGVQDFNEKVLQSINRFQQRNIIQNQINLLKSLGIRNYNVDLIYGLPNQTLNSFTETLERVIELEPSQITLNYYVHIPFAFPNMNKINEEELPDEETKLDMLLLAGEKLSHYGYKNYAQNFYCKNKDYLWQFLNKYQGDLDCDFIGFGPFSSSFINGIGVNSYDKMKNYYAMLDNNEFPVKIGYQYNTDDLIRNYVIHYMQANLCIKKKIIEQAYRIDFDSYFKNELIKLKIMEDDGLLTIKDDVISLTKEGKIYVTNILMVFDSYPHWKEILSVEI